MGVSLIFVGSKKAVNYLFHRGLLLDVFVVTIATDWLFVVVFELGMGCLRF